jgi:hypothetical protein
MNHETVVADVSAKKESSNFSLKYRNQIIEIIRSLLPFIYTAFSKLAGDTSVPGQSLLQGRKAAVEALALPITASLISVSLIFPERIRIWKSYGSFETMAILPIAWHIRPFLRQTLSCSCDGWLKQMK